MTRPTLAAEIGISTFSNDYGVFATHREIVNLDALEFQGGQLTFLGLAKRERQ